MFEGANFQWRSHEQPKEVKGHAPSGKLWISRAQKRDSSPGICSKYLLQLQTAIILSEAFGSDEVQIGFLSYWYCAWFHIKLSINFFVVLFVRDFADSLDDVVVFAIVLKGCRGRLDDSPTCR